MTPAPLTEVDGILWCIAHDGVCNEDILVCDMRSGLDDEPCDFRVCLIDPLPEARVDRA